jgi:hypothetical protein
MPDDLLFPIDEPAIPAAEFCAGQAEAIRLLVKRSAADILDIGRRLIAVKQRLGHGQWLPWLDKEFGWHQTTAAKFIRVAESVDKLSPGLDLSDCTIDAGALYLLAAPEASDDWRREVVETAHGKRITVEEAETIAARQVAEAVRKAREESRTAVDQAVKQAATQIKQLRQELEDRDEAAATPPSLDDAISLLAQLTGKKSPPDRMIYALARELGETITYRKKTYPPTDEATAKAATADLQRAADFAGLLARLALLPAPAEMLALLPGYLRAPVGSNLRLVDRWLGEFIELFEQGETDAQ